MNLTKMKRISEVNKWKYKFCMKKMEESLTH